ncbi:MAG: N-methyl-L-tryptophan oxidase [Gemmatimonadaceae bacterium]
MTFDVIVVGAGGMGSAAAYHLTRRGKRVLALERHGIAHDLGSSHGITRIIRLAYFEHPSYVPLLRRAYELWRELQSAFGEQLLHITGSIDAGEERSRTFSGSLASCTAHDLPHEVLTSAQLSARFPGYQLPPGHRAVLQPEGGFLLPEPCIEAHIELARAGGADVRAHERAFEWEVTAEGTVMVETELGVYEAEQLVIAAGAWTGQLVPSLGTLLTPERQVLGWFGIEDRDVFAPQHFPVFNLDFDGRHWYGFPEFAVPGFKVGCYHHLREAVDAEDPDWRPVSRHDIDLLRSCVRQCFPAADGDLVMSKVCLFTNTPDEDFIIDRLPGSPQVVIASPCSGHGFKFASVIGEIVADLVTRGGTAHDIARHRVSRFAVP